jgi:hypothetical protein
VVVQNRNFSKQTESHLRNEDGVVEIGEELVIPVTLVREQQHPLNLVRFEIRRSERLDPPKQESPSEGSDGKEDDQVLVLASLNLHLHDITRASPRMSF